MRASTTVQMCVVIKISSYPTVKNNEAYHAFGEYWMQAGRFLNYRLKYCWPKVIYWLLHMSRVVRWQVFHRPCRYFTANLAKAGILKYSVWNGYCENKIICCNLTLKGTNAEFLKSYIGPCSESCQDSFFSEV